MIPQAMAVRRWLSALALTLAAAALGPSVTTAQTEQKTDQTDQKTDQESLTRMMRELVEPRATEDLTVRSPDSAPQPRPDYGILTSMFPSFGDTLKKSPPFFRDSNVTIRLRTFYFNRQNDDDTASEAWAGGGWIQYTSGWLADTLAIGATYYTSLPFYAPDDRGGSALLTPGQDAIGVFGEAWAALRYKDYALLRGGRVKIDDGYVNSQDNRMMPNTFEAITLSGKIVDWLSYDFGYIWNIKPRDSNDFISMSRQAGAPGSNEGVIMTSLSLTPIKDLELYVGNFHAPELFNTLFGKATYTHVFGDVKVQAGLQYTDQRSTGDERVGDFATWNLGVGGRVLWRGLQVGVAAHFTGDDASISSPWGSWPGYLSLQVTDFDRANEKAFGVATKYDFGGTLLPFRVPGLSVQLLYAQGNDRIDPATNRGLPTTREGNLDIIYNVAAVKGLSLRFRNAYIGRGGDTVQDFRLIVNYEADLL